VGSRHHGAVATRSKQLPERSEGGSSFPIWEQQRSLAVAGLLRFVRSGSLKRLNPTPFSSRIDRERNLCGGARDFRVARGSGHLVATARRLARLLKLGSVGTSPALFCSSEVETVRKGSSVRV
jgi:hypothetical protein